jgi:acyl-coenzyme A synthetase/AMP-(fatty) acid ligase
MIHLKEIKEHTLRSPQKSAFVHHNMLMTWAEFQIETENKINFLISRYPTDLPHQACYISPNRIDLMPWLAAFATLSIPVTGLEYTQPVNVLAQLTNLLKADFILISTKAVGVSREINSIGAVQSTVFDLDSLSLPYTNAVWDRPAGDLLDHLRDLQLPKRAFRAIGFTSGTTGLPKLVLRTQSFDQRRFSYFTNRYQFNRDDRFLLSMPLYHAAGNGWARLFLNLGATIFITEIDSPNAIAMTLRDQGNTVSVMSPVILEQLLNEIDNNDIKEPLKLRWLLIGGKHFSTSLKQRALKKLGPVVYEYYGTTETGVNTIAEPADLADRVASVGKTYDGNEIAIIGPTGIPLPPFEIGTIAVNSYMNMDSYGDGAVSELRLDGQRYLLTAEQGYIDEQSRLFLLNRSNCNDCRLNLYRLEDAIRNIPCISDVAIMHSGGTFDCAVSLKQGYINRPDILNRIHSLAAEENVKLSRCRFVLSIPYSPSGKVRVGDLASVFGT